MYATLPTFDRLAVAAMTSRRHAALTPFIEGEKQLTTFPTFAFGKLINLNDFRVVYWRSGREQMKKQLLDNPSRSERARKEMKLIASLFSRPQAKASRALVCVW